METLGRDATSPTFCGGLSIFAWSPALPLFTEISCIFWENLGKLKVYNAKKDNAEGQCSITEFWLDGISLSYEPWVDTSSVFWLDGIWANKHAWAMDDTRTISFGVKSE